MEVKDARLAQGAETQKLLRRQARKLFAQKGYSGANTNELVERAKLTKGALYHHFTNKRDLYQARQDALGSELEILRAQAEQREQELAELRTRLDQLVRSHALAFVRFASPSQSCSTQ